MRSLFAVFLTLSAATAVADGDRDLALRLRQRQEVLPLEELLRRLELGEGVRILEIESEIEHGTPLYEIEYVDAGGRIREIMIDARNGQVLADEEGD